MKRAFLAAMLLASGCRRPALIVAPEPPLPRVPTTTVHGAVLFDGEIPAPRDVLIEDPRLQEAFARVVLPSRPTVVDRDTRGVAAVLVWLTDDMGDAPAGAPAVPPAPTDPPAAMAFDGQARFLPPALVAPPQGGLDLRNGTARTGVFEMETFNPHDGGWAFASREQIGPGDAAGFVLPRRMGLVRFRHSMCDWTYGYALATPSPFALVTGSDGRFEFRNVPVGRHVLRVFHGALGTRRIEVDVTESGPDEIEIRFGP